MARNEGRFGLEVALDASSVEDFKPEGSVKVALVASDGKVTSKVTNLNTKGQGSVSFGFERPPGSLQVIVGPGDASDQEIVGLQTITHTVSASVWGEQSSLKLPVTISAYYWYWWRRWCRIFTITGRVVCPDGSPVPGAVVCAYDVDKWWKWWSLQQVGCATTDANGTFALKFRWCCGWWPWWWWRERYWQLEPSLAEQITTVLERQFDLPRLGVPSPQPSLGEFETLLARDGLLTRPPSLEVDPAILPALREKLLERLPAAPELQELRLWPWWPWQPWWDCTPDLIFKVTQECQGANRVVVDENVFNTRWDIPTNLSLTLVANDQACCRREPPPPEGNCVVISSVCGDLLNTIGGNPGAPASPAGFFNPGVVAYFGDRPYAGEVSIAGLFGTNANVDYYEFEWATNPKGPWNPMPPTAAGGFSRWYWGSQVQPGCPNTLIGFHKADFNFVPISGRNVIESREHFEANACPADWGIKKLWVSNRDLLMAWLTENTFADGTYYLRLVGYNEAGGNLVNRRVLPLCDTQQDNQLVLSLDNRVANSPAEPTADVVDVRINGVSAGPCSNVNASQGGTLEVDFVAYDPDPHSHLALYTLAATYGKNLAVNLLTVPGATLSGIAIGLTPAAAQVGPDYGAALGQGAVSPMWGGGGIRLHIPDLRKAFPETCCYQIELKVYKRTVYGCDHSFTHNNQSSYSLTVAV